jgi:hypothetical protein
VPREHEPERTRQYRARQNAKEQPSNLVSGDWTWRPGGELAMPISTASQKSEPTEDEIAPTWDALAPTPTWDEIAPTWDALDPARMSGPIQLSDPCPAPGHPVIALPRFPLDCSHRSIKVASAASRCAQQTCSRCCRWRELLRTAFIVGVEHDTEHRSRIPMEFTTMPPRGKTANDAHIAPSPSATRRRGTSWVAREVAAHAWDLEHEAEWMRVNEELRGIARPRR